MDSSWVAINRLPGFQDAAARTAAGRGYCWHARHPNYRSAHQLRLDPVDESGRWPRRPVVVRHRRVDRDGLGDDRPGRLALK